MILTTIKIHSQHQKRKEILQTIRGLAEEIAKADGCNGADLYQDLCDKDVFYILEEWRTEKDLEKHKKSKSLAVLFGLESLLVKSLEIQHAVNCKSVNEIEQE